MPQDGRPRRVSLVFPIILIAVGVLFLLHNWRPAFDPWPILGTYWPLILIFIGIGKIWDSAYRSRNPNAPPGVSIGATFGALAFVVVLVFLLWHGRSFSRRHGFYSASQHNAQTVDLQGAKSAHATLELGAGQLVMPEIRAADLAQHFARLVDEPHWLADLQESAWRRRKNASWRRVVRELSTVLNQPPT